MQKCVSNLIIIGSENGLSPCQHQAIIWTNTGILLIRPSGTNFSEILIEIHTFSFKTMHLKMSSGNWRPFCLGLNVLRDDMWPSQHSPFSKARREFLWAPLSVSIFSSSARMLSLYAAKQIQIPSLYFLWIDTIPSSSWAVGELKQMYEMGKTITT